MVAAFGINAEVKWHVSCCTSANYEGFGADGANRLKLSESIWHPLWNPPATLARRHSARRYLRHHNRCHDRRHGEHSSLALIIGSSTAPKQVGDSILNARKPNILVVDDDASIRETLRELLEDSGYAVAEARDGLQALEYLRKSPAPVVVLLDLMMPRMDGAAVLGAVAGDLGRLRRHAYIMMTAGHQTMSLAFAHLLADLDVQVIYKPFDIDRLLETIANQRPGQNPSIF